MIQFFTQHRVAANLLLFFVLAAGLWSMLKINAQFLPHFDINYITVDIVWPKANATDVERSVLIPLERKLRDLSNLKKMNSTARNGVAHLVLEFDEQADMNLATEQTKSRVAQAQPFPSDSEPPIVTRIEKLDPIANVLLYGNIPVAQLKQAAYRFEADLLDRGIDKIIIKGIPEEEIRIEIPSTTLLAIDSNLDEIASLVRHNNPETPVGQLGPSGIKREIRIPRQAEDSDAYHDLFIRSNPHGENIQLGDIANIFQTVKDSEQQLFYKGQPAIVLTLLRNEFGDAFSSADKLHAWHAEYLQQPIEELQVALYGERWELIAERLNLLVKNGLTGLLFILIVLFLFLQHRVAFWIAFGIPVALISAIAILYFSGGSINMVSLFALIMSLGIIVDDTIVVGENALVQYRSGKSPAEAAIDAARLMAKPVIASSLTTVAAFLPLIVISGVIGQILGAIPFVVICVILASLIECFLILPFHLKNTFMSMNNEHACAPWRQKFEERFQLFKHGLFLYGIRPGINHPTLPIMLACCVLIFSLTLVFSGKIGFTFFPTPDGNQIKFNAAFISGTDKEIVLRELLRAEATLMDINEQLRAAEKKDIVVLSTITTGVTADTQGDQTQKFGETYGHITVEIVGSDKRVITNQELIQRWQKALPKLYAIDTIEITSLKAGPPGRDIDILLTGASPNELKKAGNKIKEQLYLLNGVRNVADDLPYGKQSIELTQKWGLLNSQLSIQEVASQLRSALSGVNVHSLQKGRDEVDVKVMLPEEERESLDLFDYYPIKTPQGSMLPLADLVTAHSAFGFEELRHSLGEMSIHITAEVNSTVANANQILAQLQDSILADIVKENPSIQVNFAGRSEEQTQTLGDMLLGAMIGVFLVYGILVLMFNSYSWPIVMMFILPFAMSGAILGHWFMGFDLTILSLFGIFGLSGIVANDGIILVNTFLSERTKQKTAVDALYAAVEQRFRAVFLTSITTVVGLLPLLFESSHQAQFLIPMAISISFGLIWGFILILFVLPALVVSIDSSRDYYQRLLEKMNRCSACSS